jgi:hypothetical protein
MDNHLYVGVRDEGGLSVFMDGTLLSPRKSRLVHRHSERFEWGYTGAGPAQLALAVLIEECGPEEAARRYRRYRRDVISSLHTERWTFTSHEVQRWLQGDRERHPLNESHESVVD